MSESKIGLIDVSRMPVEQGVNRLISHAVDMPAGDLFYCTNETNVTVGVRHLGIVYTIAVLPLETGRRHLAHIKAMSGLDVSEKRRPQDGRWIHKSDDGSMVDLRINMLPTLFGEDLALRLLARDKNLFPMDGLGLTSEQLAEVMSMLESPSGLILITGPTGSGKTATLYACLSKLNDGKRRIHTIEDPVEFTVDGLRQSQVNAAVDLNFATLLRGVLRQSPDIIMIGEVRDVDTAETAVRAANSGHLVFATIHAPVAAAGILSMRALGIQPHFLSTCLRGIIAQRLVRTLCPDCKTSYDLGIAPHTFDEVRQWLSPDEGKTFFAPRGCARCHSTGYAGRTGVFEVLPVNRQIRSAIAEARPTREIRHSAAEAKMLEFRQAALLKVARGITSTEEIFRVIPSEHLIEGYEAAPSPDPVKAYGE